MRPLNLKRIAAQLQTHVEKKCGKKMLKNIACAHEHPPLNLKCVAAQSLNSQKKKKVQIRKKKWVNAERVIRGFDQTLVECSLRVQTGMIQNSNGCLSWVIVEVHAPLVHGPSFPW